MRDRLLLAFSLVLLGLAARAAESPPRPTHTAGVGTVSLADAITLEPGRAVGLWSARYTLPQHTAVQAVRLVNPRAAAGCDIITQFRCAGQDGPAGQWAPTNLLANGDFLTGVLPGCTLHRARTSAIPRWASRPAGSDETAAFWSAAAMPGSHLGFLASVAGEKTAARLGTGARFLNARSKPLLELAMLAPGAPPDTWRRLAVGTTTPLDARTFQGLGLLRPATKNERTEPRVRAANGMLFFCEQAAAGAALIQDHLSAPDAWDAFPPGCAAWQKDAPPTVKLAPAATRRGPTALLIRKKLADLKQAKWVELRATLSLNNARATVTVMFFKPGNEPAKTFLILRCSGVPGTYRVWGRGAVPPGSVALRLGLQATPTGTAKGSVTCHRVEVRSAPAPPGFSRRPPLGRLPFPAPPRGRHIEVRSFLLTASPTRRPSFEGYTFESK